MKTMFFKTILILVVSYISSGNIIAQTSSMFTLPARGELIKERGKFLAETNIDNYEPSKYHYWVCEAIVTDSDEHYAASLLNNKKAVIQDMSNWKLSQVWPKYYIKDNPYQGYIFDNGSNINPYMQPVVLFIVKADASLNQYITNWFADAEKRGYPGIPYAVFEDRVISKLEIFFP